MPAKMNYGKSGSKRAFRTTDKCVQAEMKNKVETARLQLQKRFLDRQQYHNKFMVEKDKRQAKWALGKMRTTSGLSLHGVPPTGPSDRTHETSPYFKSYRPLTEKRLVRWRAKESGLQRMLTKTEDMMIPPWEKDPNEDMSEKFGNMMRSLGYSVEDDDMAKGIRNGGTVQTPEKVQIGFYNRKVDPFECLKQDMDETDVVDFTSFSSLKPKEFSIADWTKRTMERYRECVTQPVSSNTVIPRRVKSAMPRMQGQVIHSEPAWGSLVNGQKRVAQTCTKSRTTLIRPHTATGTPRYETANDISMRRPNSAGNSSLSGHSTSEEDMQTSITRTRSDTNSGSDMSNAGLDSVDGLDNGMLDISKHNNNTGIEQARPAQSNVQSSPGKQMLSFKFNSRSTMSSSSLRTMTNSSGSITSGDKKDSFMQRQSSDVTDLSQRTDSKLSTRDSKFLLGTVLNADNKRTSKATKVTFSDEKDVEGQSKTSKTVKSVEHLVKLTKDSGKLADFDIHKLGANLEDISGLKNDQVDELFTKMPQNRKQRTRQEILLNKAEHRISIHSQPHKKPSTVDALDDFMDSDDDDEEEGDTDEEDGDIIQRMPQWKRELMAEAPPGLFGPKSPAKVVVAMSKAQRKRELEALVTENISDKKKIIDRENARRIRSRLHMYFTMRKLNDAAETISGDTEHS